jgi:PIN domain nuclease of toxin-antitoxin system
MRILLDTHVWLWMVTEPDRLSSSQRDTLIDPETELYLSSVSIWELTIKLSVGKLKYTGNAAVQIPIHIAQTGVRALSVTAEHALAVLELPPHHRDPFDRMLIAQARVEALTLMTADQRFADYDVPLLNAVG